MPLKFKHFSAYVDFTYPESLAYLPEELSTAMFAGIHFSGFGEGIWDEVPAARLDKDFLGLRVELGGTPGESGGYTLQVEPKNFPWERIPDSEQETASVDLSSYLQFLLKDIKDIKLKSSAGV